MPTKTKGYFYHPSGEGTQQIKGRIIDFELKGKLSDIVFFMECIKKGDTRGWCFEE